MGSGGVAIAALPTVICLKVPFSDGLGGGGCPRTTDHKSEILQSVSSSDDSCLSYGNNYQLLGDNTSNPSSATYNLKVENSQN